MLIWLSQRSRESLFPARDEARAVTSTHHCMRVADTLDDLREIISRSIFAERFVAHVLVETATSAQFHYKKHVVLRLEHFVERDNVLVL